MASGAKGKNQCAPAAVLLQGKTPRLLNRQMQISSVCLCGAVVVLSPCAAPPPATLPCLTLKHFLAAVLTGELVSACAAVGGDAQSRLCPTLLSPPLTITVRVGRRFVACTLSQYFASRSIGGGAAMAWARTCEVGASWLCVCVHSVQCARVL